MGIIRNLFWGSIARDHNRRTHRIRNRLFGHIPYEGNVVICGGNTSRTSTASYIKRESFLNYLTAEAEAGRPAVCIYSDDNLTPDVEEIANDPRFRDNVCFFGRTHSYIPFDANVDPLRVEQMLSRLIAGYGKRIGTYDASVQSTVTMLLNLLRNCFPHNFYTYPNLCYLVSHLVNTGNGCNGYRFTGEMEFVNWLSRETNSDVSFYVNQLTLNWNSALTSFFNFWRELESEIGSARRSGLAERSVYSCLRDRKVCIIKLSSNYNRSLVELILNELAFYKDYDSDYTLINYNVDLSRIADYNLLDEGRTVIIGNTLASIGMKDYNPPRASFVSLGVTAEDANAIFGKMVAAGWWTTVTGGFGHHSQTSYAPSQQNPITANELVNVTDGGAYIIGPRGYEQVRIMLT